MVGVARLGEHWIVDPIVGVLKLAGGAVQLEHWGVHQISTGAGRQHGSTASAQPQAQGCQRGPSAPETSNRSSFATAARSSRLATFRCTMSATAATRIMSRSMVIT